MGMLSLSACLLTAACGDSMAWLAGEPPEDQSALPPGAVRGMVGHGTWRGIVSRAQGTTYLVARTQQEWQALWDLAGSPAPAPLPERYMAVAVFLGARTGTAQGVDIVNLRVERRVGVRDSLLVDYREVAAAQPVGTGNALYRMSSPYAIMLIDTTDVPVHFIKVS